MSEIDKTVADYLESQNIKFDIRYLSDISHDKKWPHDLWQYTFSKQSVIFTEQFKTGIGLRQLDKTKENSIPTAPTAAAVLYCVILDASALDSSFEYWCADYGYDSDRISHFNIYQHCCKIGKEMRKVFTQAQINQLHQMLQDY